MQIPTVQYCPNFGSDATLSPLDSFVTWDTAGDVDDCENMCSGGGKPGGAFVRSADTARFLSGGGEGCELRNNFWAKVWAFDGWGGWRERRPWRRRRLNDIVAISNQLSLSSYPSPNPKIIHITFNAITRVCLFISSAAFFPQRNETSFMSYIWLKVKS